MVPEDVKELAEAAKRAYAILAKMAAIVEVTFSQPHLEKLKSDLSYELERILKNVKEELMYRIVAKTIERFSYVEHSDVEHVLKKYEESNMLDFTKLAEELSAALRDADSIALENLIEKARELLPYSKKSEVIERIVKGKKLKLWHRYDFEYGFGIYDLVAQLGALHRLAIVLSQNFRPSTDIYSGVETYFRRFHHKELLPGEKHEFSGIIRAIRLYKNGNLDVWFKDEKLARAVAEALVYGAKWDGNKAVILKPAHENLRSEASSTANVTMAE